MTLKSYTRNNAPQEEVEDSIWKRENINIKILAPLDPAGAPRGIAIV